MNYHVVITTDFSKLEKEVDFLIKKGWRCQGGIAIAAYLDTSVHPGMERFICSQALVLERPKV